MNAQALAISNWQLGFAALLILVNLLLSAWLRLGLTRSLLVASLRMVVQLLLIGFILEAIFALNHPLPVVGIGLVMVTLAGISAVNRTQRRFPGIYVDSVLCVFGASFVVTGAALLGIINVDPWYRAQYAIPLLGMVLGNILNGVSLALNRFTEGAARERKLIESSLALGATRWEAAHPLITASLHTGMIPTINSMMVMGIVSLPGMMTGQLLAGAAPESAVRYQIVIMFMIAAATALGAFGVVMFAFRVLFTREHQLRADRLSQPQAGVRHGGLRIRRRFMS
ncbi:MAG: iron export ABC transporter permease subunit FetB [Nevskiaceae bacterium]|nr:MAG: iron export ABC transporter permease subunit FetB [Nevskiaceae bacterium]TBR71841.1 MAG: iron export ABC transporter permease subunit FetB [Nevskiaceae bacterium]